MLNQNRRGSNSADSGDDYGTAVQHQHHHYDSSRNQGLPRRGSVDSRMELTSPVFHHQSTSHRSNSSSNAGSRLLPSEYPDSASPPSSAQPYTSSNGNNGNLQQQRPLHERPPLYPITTQGGSRSGTLGSARSWSAQQEDGMKPHSPMMSSPVSGLPRDGGMAASATSPTRGGNGYGPSRAAEMEYISDERSETGSGYDAVQKRPSDGAISWTGSNSSSSRGGLESQSSPHAYYNSTGGLGLRKESSWSSFSMAGKGNGGDSSAVSLPPVSALAGGQHDIGDDMEMQDSHHHPRPSQHLQQQREGDRQSSGSENNGAGSNHHRGSIAMISDSPEMISSESRLHNTKSGSVMTPQMPGRQPYFSSQHQQLHSSPFSQPQQQHQQHVHAQHHPNHRGGHHPMSPGNEYPPSLSTGGRGGGAGSEMDGVYEQPRYTGTIIPTGYHEETMMRSP
ncbi:hypothetical protein BGX29_010848 [Mortierella sp. GBA35]|nr:hypothetical protein BGX29_010848 [Mortierella sp. GBA35]